MINRESLSDLLTVINRGARKSLNVNPLSDLLTVINRGARKSLNVNPLFDLLTVINRGARNRVTKYECDFNGMRFNRNGQLMDGDVVKGTTKSHNNRLMWKIGANTTRTLRAGDKYPITGPMRDEDETSDGSGIFAIHSEIISIYLLLKFLFKFIYRSHRKWGVYEYLLKPVFVDVYLA